MLEKPLSRKKKREGEGGEGGGGREGGGRRKGRGEGGAAAARAAHVRAPQLPVSFPAHRRPGCACVVRLLRLCARVPGLRAARAKVAAVIRRPPAPLARRWHRTTTTTWPCYPHPTLPPSPRTRTHAALLPSPCPTALTLHLHSHSHFDPRTYHRTHTLTPTCHHTRHNLPHHPITMGQRCLLCASCRRGHLPSLAFSNILLSGHCDPHCTFASSSLPSSQHSLVVLEVEHSIRALHCRVFALLQQLAFAASLQLCPL